MDRALEMKFRISWEKMKQLGSSQAVALLECDYDCQWIVAKRRKPLIEVGHLGHFGQESSWALLMLEKLCEEWQSSSVYDAMEKTFFSLLELPIQRVN